MTQPKLRFALTLTGVVSPLGDYTAADWSPDAMTPASLQLHLDDAVSAVLIGNGLITGDTLGTLDSHEYSITVTEVIPNPEDRDLSAEELEQKYNPTGGCEHPDFPREDWRQMVQIEDTLSGYWVWVHHMLTSEEETQ